MEPLSQEASKSPKEHKARRASKADKSDVGHKGTKKKAKAEGPKHGKHHTTTTEATETTVGTVRVHQAATVPKPEEEVPSTRSPADPTCHAFPSPTLKRIVAFVGPTSRPSPHDLHAEHAAEPLASQTERPEEAADHASPPTLPTGVEEQPVDNPPVFRRRRPSSIGKDEPVPASGTLSAKSRALDAFLKACFSVCTRAGPVRALTGDCNKAVSNFPAFARAFQCPTGSPMNPALKCLYFD